MYGFSRAIYRQLADEILEDPHSTNPCSNHERVLRACESAIERLATDRRHFARPARALFREIRAFFPMTAQLRVLRVIERILSLADEYFRSLPQYGFDLSGNPIGCRATNRKGSPCQRTPMSHNGYCPSHQHLAATEEDAAPLAA